MIDKKEERVCVVSIDDFGFEPMTWSDEEFLKNAEQGGWVYDTLQAYHSAREKGFCPNLADGIVRLIEIK